MITTAGVSAGIDGALHLVARTLGRRVADQTARYMEYHWTPEPYLTESYSYWNPSTDERGRALQRADMAADEKRWPEAIALLRKLVAERPGDETALFGLGQVLGASGDHSGAIAAYRRVSTSSPRRAQLFYQLAREYMARGDRKSAAQYVSRALGAGLGRMAIQHDPALASLGEPARPARTAR